MALSICVTLAATLGHAGLGAQPQAPPSIQRVTVQPDTGVLTIVGTGLGQDLMVVVDGQPVTVLPGASDTQLDVMAPATVLSTPGTYRLTVADPARQRGDGFIVASPPLPASPGRQIPEVRAPTPGRVPTARESANLQWQGRQNGPSVEPQLAENNCVTAVGTNALANNIDKFCGNTGVGREAAHLTTTGLSNTVVGAQALRSNTTGSFSTALGFNAGLNATTGGHNIFLGADVVGTAGDANTMRLGRAYNSGTGVGQAQTFIAGIHGTQLTGSAVQVFVDANGQLGTVTPPIASGSGTAPAPALQQQLQAQQALIAELRAALAEQRARLARLEAAVRR